MDTETRDLTLRQTYLSVGSYDLETNNSVDSNGNNISTGYCM